MIISKGGDTLKRRFLALISAFSIILLSSCANAPKKSDEHFFAMDTYMTIEAYGENADKAVREAKSSVIELEKLLSVNDENSEIYAVNHGENPELSKKTLDLVTFSLEIAEKTGGAFDPTVFPITAAWGFTTDEKRVPQREEIALLLKKVGYEKAFVSEKHVNVEEGMTLDFGGIAKGYASDKCAAIMRENGVKSALINLGGNVYAFGTRLDGNLWRIGVADPLGESAEDNAGVLSVSDRAVVTSGNYQRSFTQDGVVYGHIIDPKTGYPADSGLLSVTVVAADGTLCDALSTALFVMGKEKAADFFRENGGFDMILIDENGEIYITDGLRENFTSDRTVHIIN